MSNPTIAIAQTAAALMDSIHGALLRDRFYATRNGHDGMVGMWSTCAHVALAAEDKLAGQWGSEERDCLADVDTLATYMVLWQETVRLIEYPADARELVDDFVAGRPYVSKLGEYDVVLRRTIVTDYPFTVTAAGPHAAARKAITGLMELHPEKRALLGEDLEVTDTARVTGEDGKEIEIGERDFDDEDADEEE